MDESEVLVRVGALPVAEAFLDRALEALRGFGVIARLVLLQSDLDRRRRSLERAEDRAPHRVARLGRGELESGIDAERLAKFLAAGALAGRRAVHKGEVLVRVRALAVGQAEIDRTLEVARRLRILAVLVLAQPGAERRGAFARLEQFAQRLRGTAAKRDQEAGDHERAPAHRKRCRTRTASPASRFSYRPGPRASCRARFPALSDPGAGLRAAAPARSKV